MNTAFFHTESLRRLPRSYAILAALLLVAIGVILVRHFSAASPEATVQSQTPHVQLALVSDLSAQAGPLSVVGTVTSESQASILSQSSGPLVSLPRSLGDYVAAGEVIGTIESSSQRAAVTSAEGAYEAAQASLEKAQGTTAQNSGITSAQAAQAAQNAAAALAVSLQSAYASLDDAIRTRADALFINPTSNRPQLLAFTISDSQLVITVEGERVDLGAALSDAETTASSASSDPSAAASNMLGDLHAAGDFLQNMVSLLNKAVPNPLYSAATIASDQASITAARSEVVSAISSVTGAKTAYDAALASSRTAANSAGSGTESDIASAQAALKSAQGALDAAKANLEKTIIRSPISGTIVSLPVTLGDYVTTNQAVAVVSNPNALYVDAEVTPADAQTLSVGGGATVAGSISGVITFIAPALDPATGKIEVKVGIRGDSSTLTDGETISLSLERSTHVSKAANGAITIPIAAAKITPGGAAVFVVSTSSASGAGGAPLGSVGGTAATLRAHPITFGAILGDRVEVSGLLPSDRIVTDARGLSEGEQVIVDSSASTTP